MANGFVYSMVEIWEGLLSENFCVSMKQKVTLPVYDEERGKSSFEDSEVLK